MSTPSDVITDALALLRENAEREGYPAIARELSAAFGKPVSEASIRSWLAPAASPNRRELSPKKAAAIAVALTPPAVTSSNAVDDDDEQTTISIVDELRESYRVAKKEQRRVSSDPKSTHRDRAAAATGARAALRDLQKFETVTESAILRSEVWLRMADRILDALKPFPEARQAVVDAVTEHERDEQLGRARRS